MGVGAPAVVLFALLAVAHTWPLASAPAHLSRNDNADTILNEWIVGWIGHAAARGRDAIFNGNIFYPERRTLSYSEPLLVPAVLGAPLTRNGASPVLVYNLLALAGLTFTAWAGCLLATRWTGDRAAGLVAGAIMAFNAHTLTRLPHLQALHAEFLPLALLAFDRLLSSAGGTAVRDALVLALVMSLAALTSYYELVLTATALAVGWIVRVEDWRDGRAFRRLGAVGLAAAASLAVVLPVLAPYRHLGQVRPLGEIALYSATWSSYLMTPARVHFDAWSSRFFAGHTALFPGVTALALAAVAIGTGAPARDPRARMALGIALAGCALSFGPGLPGYAWLYQAAWPLQGIRNAARFGYLAIVGIAILSGYAVAWVRRTRRGARWIPLAVGLVLAAVTLDALAAPLELVAAEEVSPVHARLEGTDAIVAEFPFYPPDRMFRQAPYLLHSMRHWRPMINGYSGVAPESYAQHSRELAGFPDDRALQALRRIGVTHVFVHDRALREWTDDATADAVPANRSLMLIERDADVALYALAAR